MWQPRPQVLIGTINVGWSDLASTWADVRDAWQTAAGTNVFTGQTVNQVSIRRGRQTVYERPNAGYATIELRDIGDLPTFVIGAKVRVTIEDSSGNPVNVFGGFLSDWSAQTVATGGDPVVFYRLQAVGELALLNRRVVFADGRVEENDGQRVRAAVLATGKRWEEVDPALAWEDAEGTWENFDGFDLSIIDDGLYQVAALPASDNGYNALSVAQDAAFAADGFLYETGDGRIGYQNADRRRERQVSTFAPFPADSLDVQGLNVTQQLADITNRVTVGFDGGSQSASDPTSIPQFGLYESSLQTNLVNAQDAETRAVEFILRHGQAHRIIDQLPFNLLALDNALLDEVLAVELNDSIAVSDVPARLGFTQFQGFVEGITFTVSPFEASLVWNVSDRALSVSIPSSGGIVQFFFEGADLYVLHEFREDGEFRLFDSKDVDYLLVAGGGGGGYSGGLVGTHGGGGGAGGLVSGTATLAANTYPVTVGAGGLGGGGQQPFTVAAENGGNSLFNSLTVTGGGNGGSPTNARRDGGSGGSGGGAAVSSATAGSGGAGVASQGNDGGDASTSGSGTDAAGGGGGAGTVGGNGVAGTPALGGTGGAGVSLSITGSPVVYAGGGGGGPSGVGGSGGGGAAGTVDDANSAQGSNADGFGSGGGGAALPTGSKVLTYRGGDGSPGVVMIRYKVR